MRKSIMFDCQVSKRVILLIALFFVVSFRIFLVSDRDILATFSPYDEYWYVATALHRIIGVGSYHHMQFAHLPIYSIWLMVISDFGISARIAIDYAWLIGAGYLGIAIFQLTRKTWTGVLAFILLAYHPYSLVLFDRALAETFLTVITVFVLAAALEIWNLRHSSSSKLRRKIAIVVFCVGFAIAFHTRKEGFLLLLPIFIMAIFSWFSSQEWWTKVNRNKLGVPLIVAPIAATILLGCLLASMNYVRWGVFARYELAAPQYVRAVNALMAIDPVKATPRHVTVASATRDIAYRASPTFAQLQPYFDGGVGQNLVRMTSEMESGVTGEIGDWVFYWAIRDAAASVGWHSTARNAEDKYKAIAEELNDAFAKGTINKRSTLIPFVDPGWKKWIIHLPMSLIGELKLVVSPSVSTANIDRPIENANPKQFSDFSLLLGRRRIQQNERAEITGWVIAPKGSLIGLGGNLGVDAWSLLETPARKDVIGAIPFTIKSNTVRPNKLYVRLEDGKIGKLDLKGLRVGDIREIDGCNGVRLGIEHLYVSPVRKDKPRLESLSNYMDSSKSDAFVVLISKVWSLIGWGLLILTLAAIVISGYKKVGSDMLLIIGLVGVYLLGRVGLFGILDSSSWYGLAARYMFPAVPFFITGVVMGVVLFIHLISQENKKGTG